MEIPSKEFFSYRLPINDTSYLNVPLLSFAFGVADIVNIEAESFGKIIEPVKLELVVQPYHHVPFSFPEKSHIPHIYTNIHFE